MTLHLDASLIVSIVFLVLGSLMMAFSAGMLHERGAWIEDEEEWNPYDLDHDDE